MLDRLRLARLRRHFRAVERIDRKLDHPRDAADLRARFASHTIQRINQGLLERGVSRAERKTFRRKIVKGIDD